MRGASPKGIASRAPLFFLTFTYSFKLQKLVYSLGIRFCGESLMKEEILIRKTIKSPKPMTPVSVAV
jgi:hypothetical protein